MPTLDNAARDTVARFAQGMGLTARENEDGSFSFDFAESGRLSIAATQDSQHVVVSLTRRILLEDFVPLARIASVSGHDEIGDVMVQAGLTRADQPVLAIAMPPREFDLPRLDAAFGALRRGFAAAGL